MNCLPEDAIINGWTAWQHNTGSIWSTPEEWETTGALVQSHNDMVWELVPFSREME